MINKVFSGILLMSISAFCGKGEVIKTNVCEDSDKIIIETTDGWFVAAEWFGGLEFDEGDIVYGNLLSYGHHELTDSRGNSGTYYIEDYESDIGAAYEELCD